MPEKLWETHYSEIPGLIFGFKKVRKIFAIVGQNAFDCLKGVVFVPLSGATSFSFTIVEQKRTHCSCIDSSPASSCKIND